MTIFELADIAKKDLQITYHNNQEMRFTASLKYSETKRGGMLVGSYGNGKTPNEAINNYVDDIKGKVLVFDAMSDKRREFGVPKTLIGI